MHGLFWMRMVIPVYHMHVCVEEMQYLYPPPGPVDQMPYRIFKDSPSLLPALLFLFNTCWSSPSVPTQWKVGVLHLLGKESTKIDFMCGQTVPLCAGRTLDAIHDIYITVTSTPLCKRSSRVESQDALNIKLLTIIEETRKKHKSLVVYWLDLANNAFGGSVHHNLIHFTLKHYYVLACIVEAVFKCTRVLIVGLVDPHQGVVRCTIPHRDWYSSRGSPFSDHS